MSETFATLNESLIAFIGRQKLFFVATAPLAASGSVNVSPKGYDSFVVIDPLTVAWLDLGGSGIETLAHLRENGRITLMWCAFEGAARILRLYGVGEAHAFDDPRFPELMRLFPAYTRARAVVTVRLTRIADSCGWSVPFMDFRAEREQLRRWVDHSDEAAWRARRYETNGQSIDGLPGLISPD